MGVRSVLVLSLFFLMSCDFKQSDPSPREWTDWTESLSKRYQEEFSSPSITHHIYLEPSHPVAALNVTGSYPRFQAGACEGCPVIIRMGEGMQVQAELRGSGEIKELPAKETVSVLTEKRIFLTVYPVENEKKVRVFVHDLNQKKLDKKRKREFFSYSAAWRIPTLWTWLVKPIEVTIQRSDGSQKVMQKVAELKGAIQGRDLVLSVYNYSEDESYKQEKATMLLFRDYSNGQSTYGAGRFLNVEFPKKTGDLKNGDRVTLDFNNSYNPPCAVSTGFHCPLPQDTVSLAVEAGEKYIKD